VSDPKKTFEVWGGGPRECFHKFGNRVQPCRFALATRSPSARDAVLVQEDAGAGVLVEFSVDDGRGWGFVMQRDCVSHFIEELRSALEFVEAGKVPNLRDPALAVEAFDAGAVKSGGQPS
jgi:hypothetical protein